MVIDSSRNAKWFTDVVSSSDRGALYKRSLQKLSLKQVISKKEIKVLFNCLETGTPHFDELCGHLQNKVDMLKFIGPIVRQQLNSLMIAPQDLTNLNRLTHLTGLCCSGDSCKDTKGLDVLLKIVPQLTSLHLTDCEFEPYLIDLFESAVNVVHLDLEFKTAFSGTAKAWCQAFLDKSRILLPNVKTMNIPMDFFNSIDTLVERFRGTLTHITANCIDEKAMSKLCYAEDSKHSNHTLKELTAPGFDYYWPKPIARFTALESLDLYNFTSPSALKIIATACHTTLRRFTLSEGISDCPEFGYSKHINVAHELGQFIGKCAVLEKLTLRDMYMFSEIVDGVAHPNLRVVEIRFEDPRSWDQKMLITSTTIGKIWNRCPKLHDFGLFSHTGMEWVGYDEGRALAKMFEENDERLTQEPDADVWFRMGLEQKIKIMGLNKAMASKIYAEFEKYY